jgi:hypothetical protein
LHNYAAMALMLQDEIYMPEVDWIKILNKDLEIL